MSGRSEVALILLKQDYALMLADCGSYVKEKIDTKFTYGEFQTPDETYSCLYASWYSWSPKDHSEDAYLCEFMREHRHSFIRIGEEPKDIEVSLEPEDAYGLDEEFRFFIQPERFIDGIEKFGVGTHAHYPYGFCYNQQTGLVMASDMIDARRKVLNAFHASAAGRSPGDHLQIWLYEEDKSYDANHPDVFVLSKMEQQFARINTSLLYEKYTDGRLSRCVVKRVSELDEAGNTIYYNDLFSFNDEIVCMDGDEVHILNQSESGYELKNTSNGQEFFLNTEEFEIAANVLAE